MQTNENIDTELMHSHTTFPELNSDLKDKFGKKETLLDCSFWRNVKLRKDLSQTSLLINISYKSNLIGVKFK